eukprot:TRINITY_DN7635_c0_g2_i3.p1 TRINITY_DN7635_c0_g2~~TRINITY_DN7635_c0_g2_i3.p1  ORF type:complete len:386 (-),score=70.58 TRINITY_DN7635_c0_g2_i3:20-1177(-)
MNALTPYIIEKNSVFFRFASNASAVEKVEFSGREIAVGDLKQAIASKKGLQRLDLILVNERTNEVYKKEGAMLQRNITVTVKRTPPQIAKKPTVLQVEHDEDLWAKMEAAKNVKKEEEAPTIHRRPLPAEYMCPLCRDIFEDPAIARCCGRSACTRCFAGEERDGPEDGAAVVDVESLGTCRLCQAVWTEETKPIPNPRMAEIVASLDLDYFILPKEATAQRAAARAAAAASRHPAEGSAAAAAATGAAASTATASARGGAGAAAAPVSRLPGEAPSGWRPPPPPPAMLAPPSPGHLGIPGAPGAPAPLPAAPGALPAGPGACPGAPVMRPCMLSPEQFAAWKASIRRASSSSSYSSRSRSEGRKRRRDRSRRAEKKSKHKRKRV